MVLFFRGRSDTMIGTSFSIPLPAAVPPLASKSSRLVCVVASLVAFLMGIGVGVTLPFALAVRESLQQQVDDTSDPGGPFASALSHVPSSGNFQILEDLPASSPLFKPSTPLPLKLWSLPSQSQNNLLSSPFALLPIEKYSREVLEEGEQNEDYNSSKALLVESIYLGPAVEDVMPKGFSDDEVEEWRKFVRQQAVVRLREGCGRMQNRLITFSNGSQSCCRYRQNFDQIQGEIFSFYLSRLLGLKNVPPSTLAVVKTDSWQWSGVGNQLALAQWAEERPVVLTKFINDLEPAFIPNSLRPSSKKRLHPLDIEMHDSKDINGLAELAQWSDLIIFDYLTGNLDRVVNNLYNMQWNPSMMEAPAHNLAQHKQSGLLVFLDNESGLLHGFRLLDKYEPYHLSLLEAVCVFRRSTANNVKELVLKGDTGKRLQRMFRNLEPDLQDFLPNIPTKSIKILNERLKKVEKQISKCENLYLNS